MPQPQYTIGSGDSLDSLPKLKTWVQLGQNSWRPSTFAINGDIATVKASVYFNVEIIRIQGTITLVVE